MVYEHPSFKISIQTGDAQEQIVEIMKQELKERLIQGSNDYFSIIEEENQNITVRFNTVKYNDQKEFMESFEKNVLQPARKAAGLEQA